MNNMPRDGTQGQEKTGHLSAVELNPVQRTGRNDNTDGQLGLGHKAYEEPNPRTDGTGGSPSSVPEVRRMGFDEQDAGGSPVVALNYVDEGGFCIVNWRGGRPINAPEAR